MLEIIEDILAVISICMLLYLAMLYGHAIGLG